MKKQTHIVREMETVPRFPTLIRQKKVARKTIIVWDFKITVTGVNLIFAMLLCLSKNLLVEVFFIKALVNKSSLYSLNF